MITFLLGSLPFVLASILLHFSQRGYLKTLLVALGINLLAWYLNLTRLLDWPFYNPLDLMEKIYSPVSEVMNRVLQ